MKIYDISQEVFGCAVYPGDPTPEKWSICSIERGNVCNLTAFSMCAHNGTHIDAPYHFLNDGQTVEQLSLSRLVGFAWVAECNGILSADDARGILKKARMENEQAARRILIKGKAVVSLAAAEVFAWAGIDLLGNESQTVGPEDSPMKVHKVLLSANVVLLEGIRLSEGPEGAYFLNAAPLSLAGADGAPCRAILIQLDQ